MIEEREASALYIEIARQHALSSRVSSQVLATITPSWRQLEPALQTMPVTSILDYWQTVSELCAAPVFGLEAGRQCHISVYGLFSHLLLSCPTLGQALKLGVNYLHLLNEAFETSLNIGKETSSYTIHYPVEHPAARHHIEFHMASVVQLAKQITSRGDWDRLSPLRVDFCHSPAAVHRDYEVAFGCEVRFHQAHHQMLFASPLLAIPGHSPNTGLHHHLLKLVQALSRQRQARAPYTRKVYNALASHDTSHTWPTLEALALALGLSPSSLKRRLKQERTCYQSICDHLRYKQARYMLTTQQRSIGEVAHQLGFSSPASFSRSFKRWSGMTPHEYGRTWSKQINRAGQVHPAPENLGSAPGPAGC